MDKYGIQLRILVSALAIIALKNVEQDSNIIVT